jgi:hypothetical protein
MITNVIDVLRAFVDGCRRLLAVWLLVLALIVMCLATTSPAIDDLNTLLSRNFVRQHAISSFQPEPVSIGRIVPYFRTWPFYFAGWMFLLGGVLEALVHRQISQIGVFVRSCAHYFFRFVRLLLLELCLKGLFLLVAIELVSAEPAGSISAMRSFYLFLSVLLMGMTTIVFTYAAIRTITEERLSMVGSMVAAARFVKRRIGSVVMLSLLNIGMFAVGVIGLILIVRPETISDVPLFLSCLFIVQLVTVLTTSASAMSYFERQLGRPKRRIVPA